MLNGKWSISYIYKYTQANQFRTTVINYDMIGLGIEHLLTGVCLIDRIMLLTLPVRLIDHRWPGRFCEVKYNWFFNVWIHKLKPIFGLESWPIFYGYMSMIYASIGQEFQIWPVFRATGLEKFHCITLTWLI